MNVFRIMGAGASSLIRLRKALVLRAYNLRSSQQTLEEQFRPIAFRENGVLYIALADVSKFLSVDAPWLEDLFVQIMDSGSKDKRMKFREFIEFLETGKVAQVEVITPGIENGNGDPTTSTIKSLSYSNSMTGFPVHERQRNESEEGQAGTKAPPLPPSDTPVSSTRNEVAVVDGGESPDSPNPSLARTTSTELVRKGSHKMTIPADENGAVKPLWKKREVMKQERTIHYTTMDAAGVVQELIEKETSETEVLHMECRETGEFAHRETTVYEQKETFNDEVVNEQFGSEEYVHLKSKEDEIEFRDSNMPMRQAQSMPQSPDPAGGHNPAHTAGAGATPIPSPGGDGITHKDGSDYDTDGESIRAPGVNQRHHRHAGREGQFSPGYTDHAGSTPLAVSGEHSTASDAVAPGTDTDSVGPVQTSPRRNSFISSDDEESVHPYAQDEFHQRPANRTSRDTTPTVDVSSEVPLPRPKSSKPKRASGSGVRFSCEDDADEQLRRSSDFGTNGSDKCYFGENVHGLRSEGVAEKGAPEVHIPPDSPERKAKLSSLFGATGTDDDDAAGAGTGEYVHNLGGDVGDNADLLGSTDPPADTPMTCLASDTDSSSPSANPAPLLRQSSSMHDID